MLKQEFNPKQKEKNKWAELAEQSHHSGIKDQQEDQYIAMKKVIVNSGFFNNEKNSVMIVLKHEESGYTHYKVSYYQNTKSLESGFIESIKDLYIKKQPCGIYFKRDSNWNKIFEEDIEKKIEDYMNEKMQVSDIKTNIGNPGPQFTNYHDVKQKFEKNPCLANLEAFLHHFLVIDPKILHQEIIRPQTEKFTELMAKPHQLTDFGRELYRAQGLLP